MMVTSEEKTNNNDCTSVYTCVYILVLQNDGVWVVQSVKCVTMDWTVGV
jgi:hypothetical protein